MHANVVLTLTASKVFNLYFSTTQKDVFEEDILTYAVLCLQKLMNNTTSHLYFIYIVWLIMILSSITSRDSLSVKKNDWSDVRQSIEEGHEHIEN